MLTVLAAGMKNSNGRATAVHPRLFPFADFELQGVAIASCHRALLKVTVTLILTGVDEKQQLDCCTVANNCKWGQSRLNGFALTKSFQNVFVFLASFAPNQPV